MLANMRGRVLALSKIDSPLHQSKETLGNPVGASEHSPGPRPGSKFHAADNPTEIRFAFATSRYFTTLNTIYMSKISHVDRDELVRFAYYVST